MLDAVYVFSFQLDKYFKCHVFIYWSINELPEALDEIDGAI